MTERPTMLLSRRSMLGMPPLLASAATPPTLAQADPADAQWPKHAVHFIVSSAPGSAGDVVCRIVAAQLDKRLGQQFVMDNRPAVGGTLAAEALARSAPDGYTVGMVTTSTHVIAKILDPSLPYDPIKDFLPISMIGSSPYVLAVYPGLPVKTVADLVALAKSKHQPLNNAAYGTTSLGYLGSLLFAQQAGIKVNQISYRSSAQAVIDVMEGRVDIQLQHLAARGGAGEIRQTARARDNRRASRAEPAGRSDARRVGLPRLRRGAVDRRRGDRRHADGHHRQAQWRNDRDPEHAGGPGCSGKS